MPPKKSSKQEPSKKTVEKKKDKIIEDKTFGLKNKKGKKQQQYVKQVANQVKFGGQHSVAKRETADFQAKQRKADEMREKQEMNSLFRPVQTQKVSAGADPKSVLCIFYTQGQCTKGDKCKFSHDLSLAGKTEKKSLYVDSRDLEEDTIDKWDEEKLKEVVDKKHGGKTKQKTDIVCKHFLHAIEKAIYGWFWECPNGEKCIYRHALPPGFVFKKVQKEAVQEETITMEELVEREREQLVRSGRSLTKVTLETFTAWKERKLKEKRDQADAEMARRKEAFSAGKTLGISGREMFEFNPNLIEEDDEEAGEDVVCYHGSDDEDAEVAAVPPLLTERLEGSEEGEETNHKDTEDVDGDQLLGEAIGGEAPPSSEQLIAEQPIVVDESLFDIENLDDLSIDEEDIMD